MPRLRARSAPRVPGGPCDAHSLSARSLVGALLLLRILLGFAPEVLHQLALPDRFGWGRPFGWGGGAFELVNGECGLAVVAGPLHGQLAERGHLVEGDQ